jgi:hypothetical protein
MRPAADLMPGCLIQPVEAIFQLQAIPFHLRRHQPRGQVPIGSPIRITTVAKGSGTTVRSQLLKIKGRSVAQAMGKIGLPDLLAMRMQPGWPAAPVPGSRRQRWRCCCPGATARSSRAGPETAPVGGAAHRHMPHQLRQSGDVFAVLAGADHDRGTKVPEIVK